MFMVDQGSEDSQLCQTSMLRDERMVLSGGKALKAAASYWLMEMFQWFNNL